MSDIDEMTKRWDEQDEDIAGDRLRKALETEALSWRHVTYSHHFPINVNGVEVTAEMAEAAIDALREELALDVSSATASYALARFRARAG